MSEILTQILLIIIPAILTWVGNRINKYLDDKSKKYVVEEVVNSVEQTCASLSSEEKYNTAVERASAWLTKKGLAISDIELKILIESSVKGISSQIKKGA